MTHIEKMKQWLEALEIEDMACRYEKEATPEYIAKAITSLRQAIKDAEGQEPVIDKSAAIRIATALGWEPKREWVGLIHDEVPEKYKSDSIFIEGWLWAESKLKEKNQ